MTYTSSVEIKFEDFKKNLTILEKRLSEDFNDLPGDIKVAGTWLEYAQREGISPVERTYLYQESLPRQIKAILMRKYDSNSSNFHMVISYLEEAIGVIAEHLSEFPEGMSVALRDLMDPNQAFYKKYCAPKVEMSSIGGVSAEVQKFLDSLEVQSCIDFLNGDKWENAVIEKFDPYRTTMEIMFIEDCRKEWVHLNENASKIAAFGSKTGMDSGTTEVSPASSQTNAGSGTSAVAAVVPESSVIDVSDTNWKYELAVGDLIDVKEKSGMWYQACILGMKKVVPQHLQQQQSSPPPLLPVQSLPLSGGSSGRAPVVSEPTDDLDGLYESLEGGGSSSVASPSVASSSATVTYAAAASAATSSEASVQIIPEDSQSSQQDGAATASGEDVVVAEPVPHTLIHVSYIGQAERFDEWIDLDEASDRIQQLNVMSCGRRGENPIREEVLFLVNLKPSHQGEINSYALYREGCFTEHQFIKFVNIFGTQYRGFDVVLSLLNRPPGTVNLLAQLNVIIAIGGTHKVLTKSSLAAFCPKFLEASAFILNNMSNADIRETPIEVVEATLNALELMAYAHFGRNAASGQILEPLRLDTALRNMLSPYLNRRLGGLKVLSELVKRADSALECPSGLRTTVTTSNNVESTSYKVVPITYFLSMTALASQLGEHPALLGLFEGGSAHESLMTRASSVLSTIAKHNCLSERLIAAVWEAGFTDRKAEAMKCLADTMAFLNPTSLKTILSSVSALDSSAITISLVEIVASIAVRCRDLMFEHGSQHLEDHPSASPEVQAVLGVYRSVLRSMWSWVTDESKAGETVSAKCIEKFEAIFDLGCSMTSAINNEAFPWAMHFHRMHDVIQWAVEAMQRSSSLVQATKVLQQALHSWPVRAQRLSENPVLFLPFQFPLRGDLANYLISSYNILEVATRAVVQLKQDTVTAAKKLIDAHSSWSALGFRSADVGVNALPITLQKQVNEMKLRGSHSGYQTQLDKCLDFFIVFCRCGDSISLPQSSLENLWKAVIFQPLTTDEVDLMVNFFTRVVLKVVAGGSAVGGGLGSASGASASSSIDLTAICDAIKGTEASDSSSSRRNSFCSRATAEWVYANLLCNTTQPEAIHFLSSTYFTAKAFTCIEKWFRWVNVEAGLLADSKVKTEPFVIVGNPRELKGLALFPTIIFTCCSEGVASSAVKLLTSLPQYFTPALKASGALIELRNYFLDLCMNELRNAAASGGGVSDGGTDGKVNLSRVLLFIEGILEESAVNSELRVLAHGTIGRGTNVVFKVSSTSIRIKPHCGDISMRLHDTVEDLFKAVARQIQLSPGEFKIFRLGRELTESDYKKTIALIRRGHENGPENLQIAERPHYKSKSPTANSGTSSSGSGSGHVAERKLLSHHNQDAGWELVNAPKTVETMESMPAWILANNADYFTLLFGLLRSSKGAAVDKIWALLGRIPTNQKILNVWLDMAVAYSAELLTEFTHNVTNLADLLYRLQIIEVLMEPTSSKEDLEAQCKSSTDIDGPKLLTWSERFILRGGFAAVVKAYDWIEHCLTAFTQDSGDQQVGVTPHLLQLSSALVIKLMRAFVVKITTIDADDSMLVILKSIKATKEANEKKTVSTTAGTNGEAAGKENKPPASVELTSTPMAVVAEEAEDEDDDDGPALSLHKQYHSTPLLAEEWGWRIRLDGLLPNSFEHNPVDWVHIHRLTLSMMVLLRKLGHTEYFNSGKTSSSAMFDSTASARLAARHAAVMNSLNDLLMVWGGVCAHSPELLLTLTHEPSSPPPFIDANLWLREVLLGQFSASLPASFVEDSKLSQPVSEWVVMAVSSMIDWSLGFKKTAGADGSLTNSFCCSLFQALLKLRPALTHADSITHGSAVTLASATAHKKMAALYTLASSLLERHSKPDSVINLPIELRKQTISSILEELRSAHTLVRSDPKVKFHNLEGTMKLLAALPCGDGEMLNVVYTRSVQSFLLTGCLGIVPLSLSTVPIVCSDENSRRYLYTILGDISASTALIAPRIIESLRAAHSSVPPPVAWEYKPERESRSVTGFVGLRNLGSTCYMNSLLQVLYMNADIREYLLSQIVYCNQSEEELRNDIAFQLRKVFFFLKYSEKKSYTPSDWTFAFKDELGVNPINVMQQQDAQEFLQLLCERFEHSIHAYRKHGLTNLVDVMHATFGGQLTNQMFKSNGGLSQQQNEIREQPETFVCISLEVKGCKNLEYSLGKFVEGEQISDYQWTENQPKETITKRQCFSVLNDTIVFHLKRFELNFDTFHREKVNDAFAFPMKLNMLPYTKEGLRQQAMGLTNSSGSSSEHPDEYYQYELGGVVVHTGTSDSGHYFSYIKESSSGASDASHDGAAGSVDKWFEFNDSEVTSFSPTRIEAECFGGVTISTDYNQHTQDFTTQEIINPKSAYMLVYNRVKKLSSVRNTAATTSALTSSVAVTSPGGRNPIQEIKAQLELENAQQALSVRVLTSGHIAMYKKLLELTFQYTLQNKRPFPSDVLNDMFQFTTKCVSHTASHDLFAEMVADIRKFIDSYSVTGWHIPLPAPPAHSSPSTSRTQSPVRPVHHKALALEVVADSQQQQHHRQGTDTPVTATESEPPSAASTAAPSPDPSLIAEPESPVSASRSRIEALKAKRQASFTKANANVAAALAEAVAGTPPRPPSLHSVMPPTPPVESHHHSVGSPAPAAIAAATPSAPSLPPVPVNQHIMHELLEDMDTVMNNLFAPNEQIRKEFASLYLKLFEVTAKADKAESFYHVNEDVCNMRAGLITTSFGGASTLMQVSSSPALDDDDELALAIKMSQENEGMMQTAPALAAVVNSPPQQPQPTICKPPTAADTGSVTAATAPTTSYELLSVRFLWELTKDSRLQQIPENWRRANSYIWLLLEISKFHWVQRDFMVRRQVICNIVDILLGDQSPLCGSVYQKGSRKRAPSSYVVVNVTKDDVLPASARNIPDWSSLLELLTTLVRACVLPGNYMPPVPHGPFQDSVIRRSTMDEWCLQSVTVKTLFSTLIRQARYSKHLIHLVQHLGYNNKQFADMMCEVIHEELFMTPIENTCHIFELIEAFVRPGDSFKEHRCTQLFGTSTTSILDLINNIKDDLSKGRLACVLIKSFVHLLSQDNTMVDACFRPHSKVVSWAPWMLKFCFRFQNKCSSESQESLSLQTAQSQLNQAILASHSAFCQPVVGPQLPPEFCLPAASGSSSSSSSSTAATASAPPVASKGPFLVVYGETAEEREMTWVARSEKTMQMLQNFLVRMGENPETLIPEDTFFDSSNTSSKAGGTGSAGAGAAVGPDPFSGGYGAAGAMTDEEFARFLANGGELD